MYDYLIVGAGLFGSVAADILRAKGHKCLVIDKRSHIGGNCYTEVEDGITVHKYGAHIFKTNNRLVWDYMRSLCCIRPFINTPIAVVNGKGYNLPFNMNTFASVFGVSSPHDAEAAIRRSAELDHPIESLEDKAISLVGRTLYEMFIKGYTEKQWGRPCSELPPSILDDIPVRFTYNNNYYRAKWQGVPYGGYTPIFEKLLRGIDVHLNTDYFEYEYELNQIAENVIYTGPIDQYFHYQFGRLEYRSLRFEEKRIRSTSNFQGVAVTNHPTLDVPYTRIIEHKHFLGECTDGTIITYETPFEYTGNDDAYYPINDEKNDAIYRKYAELASELPNVHFGGRLATYHYDDMSDCILNALNLASHL